MIWSCLAAFVFGVAVDFLTIKFFGAVESLRIRAATGWSMAMGAAGMLGISEALHSWPAKVALIAGYGVGTYWTMRAKKAAFEASERWRKTAFQFSNTFPDIGQLK